MTTRPTGRAEGLDCVVVGGGLAGLACAHRLAEAGRSVRVIEAEGEPGGRARSVWHRGRPVDRGFQTLFTGYPNAGRLIRAVGIPRRDLRPVSGGAVFIHGDGTIHRLGTSKVALARFSGLGKADRARLAALGADTVLRPADALLATDEGVTTEAFLRGNGFSDEAIEEVFRPLFGVVMLDRTLSADSGYFRFLLAMLARGPAAIPSDGLGMIAEWTSAAVRRAGGTIDLGVRATALEADPSGRRVVAVATDDGRRVEAGEVVLAVEAPAARELLTPLDPVAAARLPAEAASCATAAFALAKPLYKGRVILLNADGGPAEEGRVDLLCQTTNITRPGAPEGPHIVLATRVTTQGPGPEGLVEATERLVRRWSPAYDWAGHAELIDVYEHGFAQYRPTSGVRHDLPGPRTAVDNLVLAGDLTTHPSIEGAVTSGMRAADVVAALLP